MIEVWALGLEVGVRSLECAVFFAGERAHQNFAARRIDAREKIPDDGNMLRHVLLEVHNVEAGADA